MKTKNLWIGIALLLLLAPLGLLLPRLFRAGGAWGEWGADEIGNRAGYVPEGIKRLFRIWKSPFEDYSFPGLGEYVAYIATGAIGVLAVVAVSIALGRMLSKKNGTP